MVTDAAGTGFEIKKPHKGTETSVPVALLIVTLKFEIKKPHKGTETSLFFFLAVAVCHLKLRNPIRGRKLFLLVIYPFIN